MMDTKASLQVTDLTCIRQQHSVFNALSFALQQHELLMIEGQNGAGKSSLLRLLTGLTTPASGEIFWCNKNITTIRDAYIQQLHYIGHSNGIKQNLTVTENLILTHHLALAKTSRLPEIIESLQLTTLQNTLAKQLSAGQKRRLALAKLLLIPRKLWLLDEPLTALDKEAQTFFLTQLALHLQSGGMAIMSSHQPLALHNMHVKYLRLQAC